MRIAVVSSNECSGGAARAAFRLVEGLRRSGVRVDHYVERKERGGSLAVNYTVGGSLSGLAQDVLARVGAGAAPPWRRIRRRRAQRSLQAQLARGAYDIINVHGFNEWADPGLDRAFIAGLPAVAPLVWTLHDLWPLNGCCDYPADCRRTPPCGGRGDVAARADVAPLLDARAQATLVAPSTWMADQARATWGGQVRVRVIPYGVDTGVFRPLDRQQARIVLDLPAGGRFLLVVADRLAAPRKGVSLLLESLDRLPPDVGVILVGVGDGGAAAPLRVHELGPIHDERLLALAYAAADAVVVPSLEDNLPNVLLEGLACGRPLVGFRAGGIPDAIEPGVTGELADSLDAAGLSAAILRLLAWPAPAAEVAARCRLRAERDYPLERQARSYENLFGELAVPAA